MAPLAKGRIRLALDGGVHRGSDIFKAIALGAEFVFVGRIAIWGLAVSLSILFIPFFFREGFIAFSYQAHFGV